jgi:SAM-dependent methyltransferase
MARQSRYPAQMLRRWSDGSAGDADYGDLGRSYSIYRRPDPRIANAIRESLGPARTVLNVGAGAGSYEPPDCDVTPVEPSASMRAQRPPTLAPAIDATAEDLPFPDDSFDAAMATFSVHQWSDLRTGLAEIRRVTRGPVVILTGDPSLIDHFWLVEYAPEVLEVERQRYPSPEVLATGLGGSVRTANVPIPLDCVDGFNEAYYGRPEFLLNPDARRSCSAWSFVDETVEERCVRDLAADLESGHWDQRFGELRRQSTFEGSLILVVADRP